MERMLNTNTPYQVPRPRELSPADLTAERNKLRDVIGLGADQVLALEGLRERIRNGQCDDYSTPEYIRLNFFKQLVDSGVIHD